MRHYPDELYHYGTKGMKWGVRRSRKTGSKQRRKSVSSERKEKIKTFAKKAAITGAALGVGYVAYKNRHKIKDQLRKVGAKRRSNAIDRKIMEELAKPEIYNKKTGEWLTYEQYMARKHGKA